MPGTRTRAAMHVACVGVCWPTCCTRYLYQTRATACTLQPQAAFSDFKDTAGDNKYSNYNNPVSNTVANAAYEGKSTRAWRGCLCMQLCLCLHSFWECQLKAAPWLHTHLQTTATGPRCPTTSELERCHSYDEDCKSVVLVQTGGRDLSNLHVCHSVLHPLFLGMCDRDCLCVLRLMCLKPELKKRQM